MVGFFFFSFFLFFFLKNDPFISLELLVLIGAFGLNFYFKWDCLDEIFIPMTYSPTLQFCDC